QHGIDQERKARVAKPEKPVDGALAGACTIASGRIWTNVRLYNSGCNQEIATVLGGKSGQVKIRYDSGSEEWKNRDVVATQMFVRENDPAISAMVWFEPQD
ncbi:MAG: hypothetical protein WCA35_14335, partial [Kovacikia sp.]